MRCEFCREPFGAFGMWAHEDCEAAARSRPREKRGPWTVNQARAAFVLTGVCMLATMFIMWPPAPAPADAWPAMPAGSNGQILVGGGALTTTTTWGSAPSIVPPFHDEILPPVPLEEHPHEVLAYRIICNQGASVRTVTLWRGAAVQRVFTIGPGVTLVADEPVLADRMSSR